ncbi:hypothetical protein RSAG8_07220, partial [Rhizoctonia solani AG-8 WAC10335]
MDPDTLASLPLNPGTSPVDRIQAQNRPDEDPADEESFLWPAFTPEDYCLAIKSMIKATPNTQTLRLNLSHFHEMFAHHLAMFNLLINIMVHTSEEHIDQELIDYATMRMPQCAWHWGMSEFVFI